MNQNPYTAPIEGDRPEAQPRKRSVVRWLIGIAFCIFLIYSLCAWAMWMTPWIWNPSG